MTPLLVMKKEGTGKEDDVTKKTWFLYNKNSPVICAVSSIHRGIHAIGNEPMKAFIIGQLVGLPISVSHVATGGVQVSENDHTCNG